VRAVELAGARDPDGYRRLLADLERKHQEAFADLVPVAITGEVGDAIDKDLADIRDVLHATTLLRRHSRETLDLVTGYGEIWSARILAAYLASRGSAAVWIDAREILTARWKDASPEIDWTSSRARLERWSAAHTDV